MTTHHNLLYWTTKTQRLSPPGILLIAIQLGYRKHPIHISPNGCLQTPSQPWKYHHCRPDLKLPHKGSVVGTGTIVCLIFPSAIILQNPSKIAPYIIKGNITCIASPPTSITRWTADCSAVYIGQIKQPLPEHIANCLKHNSQFIHTLFMIYLRLNYFNFLPIILLYT